MRQCWGLLLLPLLTGAQSVRLEPDLAVAQAEFLDAEQTWLKNDPHLESDLYKYKPEVVKPRIRRAAAMRDDVMQKKEVYLGIMVSRLDAIRARAATSRSAHLPTKELKEELLQEQARLLTQQDNLDGRIKELPEGDEYLLVRRAMEAERTDLISLQNNVAMRIHGLDKFEKGQQAEEDMEKSGALDKNFADISSVWKMERDQAIRARATWAKYYTDLEKSLGNPAPADKKLVKPSTTPPKPSAELLNTQPLAAERGVAAALGKSVATVNRAADSFAGAWEYRSGQGAWVGFGEPDYVYLQLKLVAGHIEGNYSARLPGRDDMRLVSLALEGDPVSETQATMTFASEEPHATGEMSLKIGPDRRLLVERLRSNDSYIPAGMEVLLPR
jgi:hypothetical protein